MKNKILLSILLSVFISYVSGTEIYKFDTPDTWKKAKFFKKSGDALSITGTHLLYSKNVIAINPTKTYTYSITIRQASGSSPSSVHFGFIPYDDEEHRIRMAHVTYIKGTSGTLVEDVKPSDLVIKIKPAKAKNWIVAGGWVICFKAKDDYSDLPNKNISPVMKSIVNKNGILEITLRSKCKQKFPAGTKVRIHAKGGYIYTGSLAKAPEKWKTFSGTVKGILPHGWNNKSWPYTTACARPMILANWNNKKGIIEIKDIKVEEK